MALSQIQCLDDNHVNPRVHESKPEFLYCEDQRLALEALLQDGREAFFKYLETRGLRAFLSDPELETLAGSVEPYDPGSDLFPASADVDEPPLSLQYWPELSDTSIPQLDLGWPDCDAYRGVTRTTVYSQPPQDGQAHIKEIVRKMIAQAQKVIAVVMDIFTDVDIFRDLLDAGFKRRVSVYILVERTTLPHFLSMCQRANMHAGHLKNLRVRCTDGGGFYTRSSTKVRGRMGHRFMFIDGDKAVSGSYSFTWMSSRLDRNLITVITGQTVDTFDRLFQSLYVTSSSVNLRQVATEVEPEPEILPQPVSVAAPSAAIARKLYNPKYALVALGNPSPTPSDGNSSSKDAQNPDTSKNPGAPETKKGRQKRAVKEAPEEAPPIHPGLTNLEKACLISYLPTWPEPDPPSDVIGFINIRDTSKPAQVHLQRSEMFGTSQAIRFSSPITVPKETLPEVALPRQLTAKRQEANLQPAQQKNKESAVSKAQPAQLNTGDIRSKAEAPEKNSPASGPKCESNKDTTKPVDAENKQRSNTPTNQGAGHATTPHLSAHTPPQSSSKASTPNTRQPSHTTNDLKPDSLHGSNTTKKAELSSNAHSGVEHRTHILESDSTQTSQLCAPTDSNTEQHTQTKMVLPRTDSHTKLQNSSKITPNIQTPTVNSHVPSSSSTSALCSQSISPTSLSTSKITSAPLSSGSSSSLLSPRTSSSTTLNPPLTSSLTSSSLPSTPPVPKPRTVQLVIKDGVTSDGRKLPEISVVKNPPVATVMPTTVKKVPANFAEMNKQAQKNADNKGNIEEAPRQKQSGTSLETKKEEAVRDDRAGKQLVAGAKLQAQSDVLITDAPKGDGVSIQEIIPKDVEPKTLTSVGCKLTPQTDRVATVQTETKAPERVPADRELAEVPDEKSSAAQSKTYHARAQDAQRISYCGLTPQDIGVLKVVDSPVSAPHSPHVSKDGTADSTHTSPNPKLTPVSSTDSTLKYDTHGAFPELTPKRNPEKPLRLHLSDSHVPDLCSPTPERESRSLTALARTPTPDGLFPRTPTPDSRTHTPDPRSYTPDISDGYASPRTDSTLSTTSEEYYECRGSPYQEPVCERASYRNHEVAEDHVSPTHTNTTTTAPACINYNAHAATTEGNTSSSEIGPARSSSSPSLLEKKVKMREEETTNEENGREEDDKGRELNAAERETEGDSWGTKRGDDNEAKRTADPFKESKDLTETVEKNKDAQAPKRKKVLNQSAAERLVDGGVTRGESTNEGAEPKRLSTADLKPKKFPSEGERADKEKTGDGTALGPSVVLRRDKPEAAGETEGQKITLLRPPQGQQQTRVSSPSRPARPPQPLSPSQAFGPRPWGNKVLQSNFPALDNTSSPRRPPSRPPPPLATGAVGSGLGQKQVEISPSQQNLLSRQALAAAQGKTRAGQTLNQQPYPKPQASLLHTQSNMQSHLQNQTVSAHEAHSPEEGRAPFGVTFSRLYSLKGLKDKVSKLPMQSKRGSASSAAEGRKSTS